MARKFRLPFCSVSFLSALIGAKRITTTVPKTLQDNVILCVGVSLSSKNEGAPNSCTGFHRSTTVTERAYWHHQRLFSASFSALKKRGPISASVLSQLLGRSSVTPPLGFYSIPPKPTPTAKRKRKSEAHTPLGQQASPSNVSLVVSFCSTHFPPI